MEGFSWSCARTGVSVVVAYLGESTTTNCEGLMMRVTCDTKRVNTMVRTCLEQSSIALRKVTTISELLMSVSFGCCDGK